MKNEKETIMGIILQIVIAIFAIILIIQLLLKLTGHSPTETQIMIGSIVAIITYLIGASYKIMYKLGRIDQHLLNLDRNVLEIMKRLDKIEERLLHIERKI